MAEPSASVAPAPMAGHGVYNRSSRVQAAGLSPALPLLKRAARAAALAPERVIIADYGSSQGHNSLHTMAVAIGALRERVGQGWARSVVHTDLPGNDFSAPFQTLADDPESYLRGDPAVFASAVGRSFYEQLLPAGSVTLGWSSWAVQWLSRVPAPIPDHLQVAFSRDPAVRTAYARQAAEDWRTFLTHRGRELHPGGLPAEPRRSAPAGQPSRGLPSSPRSRPSWTAPATTRARRRSSIASRQGWRRA